MSTYYPFYRPIYYTHIPCPACRGYNLERQWCSVCDRKGYVNNKESK
jgi:hypothetical protein